MSAVTVESFGSLDPLEAVEPRGPAERVEPARAARAAAATARAAQHGRSSARPERVRLTRRGRVVVLLGAVAVIFGMLFTFGPSVVAATQPGEPAPVRTVTVQPGQTLWDIAAEANPSGDIRDTVYDIADLNALPSAGRLSVGQTLAVPRY